MTTRDDESRPERQAIIKAIRETVWNGSFGVDAEHGACFVCASPVRKDDFVIGHYKDGVTGGKAQVTNMRAICPACDRAIGKSSIETYARANPGPRRPAENSLVEPKKDKKDKRSSNDSWLNAFTDALWYSDFNFTLPSSIRFPSIDFPDINFPDFDFPDFDFDFDFNS